MNWDMVLHAYKTLVNTLLYLLMKASNGSFEKK